MDEDSPRSHRNESVNRKSFILTVHTIPFLLLSTNFSGVRRGRRGRGKGSGVICPQEDSDPLYRGINAARNESNSSFPVSVPLFPVAILKLMFVHSRHVTRKRTAREKKEQKAQTLDRSLLS